MQNAKKIQASERAKFHFFIFSQRETNQAFVRLFLCFVYLYLIIGHERNQKTTSK